MKNNTKHAYFLEELTLNSYENLEFLIRLGYRDDISEEEILDALNDLSKELTHLRRKIKKHLHSKK